jgi:hypothetical protein
MYDGFSLNIVSVVMPVSVRDGKRHIIAECMTYGRVAQLLRHA